MSSNSIISSEVALDLIRYIISNNDVSWSWFEFESVIKRANGYPVSLSRGEQYILNTLVAEGLIT